jgi:putative transposase
MSPLPRTLTVVAWGKKKRKTPKPPQRLRVWEYKVSKGEACLAPARELCRQIYNAALQQRRDAWKRQHVSIDRKYQQKELTALRADDCAVDALNCAMLRLTTTTRLDLAFAKFLDGLKPGKPKVGYPRFKGRSQFTTLEFEAGGWHFDGPWLVLAGIGRVRVSLYRPLPTGAKGVDGVIRGLRVVDRGGRTWVQFVVDEVKFDEAAKTDIAHRHGRERRERMAAAPPTAQVGIDVGCKTFATLSSRDNGTTGTTGTCVESQIAHPKFLRASLAALTAAQRAVSTKRRGSNRRRKAKARLTRLSARVANRRANFLHAVTRRLVDGYARIAIEDLDLVEMVATEKVVATATPAGTTFMSPAGRRGLHRSIMDSAFGMFRRMLTYKAESAGTCVVVAVPPRGTTQRCSSCGTMVKKDLRVRVHDCPACGLVLGRDENAARNIYDLGLQVGRGDVVVAAAEVGSPGCSG